MCVCVPNAHHVLMAGLLQVITHHIKCLVETDCHMVSWISLLLVCRHHMIFYFVLSTVCSFEHDNFWAPAAKKKVRHPPHTPSTRDKDEAEENFPNCLIWPQNNCRSMTVSSRPVQASCNKSLRGLPYIIFYGQAAVDDTVWFSSLQAHDNIKSHLKKYSYASISPG